MNIIENAFPDAAGGNFWCFLVFLFKIPYVLAYMTFLEILKILQNDRAYMTSYMLGQHCIRGGRGSAPNCTDGELLDDESTSAEIPEPQIDGTRDLWMWSHERICNYPGMESNHPLSDAVHERFSVEFFVSIDKHCDHYSLGIDLQSSWPAYYYYTTLRRRKILRRELLRDFFQNHHFYGMASKHPPTPGGATLLRKNDDFQEFP